MPNIKNLEIIGLKLTAFFMGKNDRMTTNTIKLMFDMLFHTSYPFFTIDPIRVS